MGKSDAQPAKGMRDLLPEQARRHAYVVGVIREVYESYGFQPLQTPALERLGTLLGKYGEEGDQLLFKVLLRGQPLLEGIQAASAHVADDANVVQGRSGRTAPGAETLLSDLGLRYDLTVPLARVCAGYQGKLPAVFKRYQIQPVWRADTPGKGRFREFYQCDVDVVGSDSLVVEVEVVAAASECLRRLGFEDFTLRLNHRGLLRALVEVAGIPNELEHSAIVAIDKLDKIGADGVRRELLERGVGEAPSEALLELLGDEPTIEHLSGSLAEHEGGSRALSELQQVLKLAACTPAAEHLRFDVALARGLSYYTGCIIEAQVPDLAGSLGGGGRYDGLVGMFSGRDVPACGFALGLERILVVMEERGLYPKSLTHADVLLAPVRAEGLGRALELSQHLRRAGLRVDLRPKAVKPGKLRQQAEAEGVAAAVWVENADSSRASLWTAQDKQSQSDLEIDAILERLGTQAAENPS
ncbi:MAG: histidine--tRNA ligase [Myxococcales bacterium]|nr:histidine--tRNA ligase [Myxococcales bacterium]